MESGYFYLFIIAVIGYYVIVRVVIPKAIQEEIEFIRQYELEQIKSSLTKDMEELHQEFDRKIGTLQQGERESLRQLLAEEFHFYKKQLEMESKKTIAMYTQQCNSFKELVKGMHEILQRIEGKPDSGQSLFCYINQEDYQTFEQIVAKELIYFDELGRRWLHIFLNIVGEIVKSDVDEAEDPGMDTYVGIRYKQLHFIKEHIVNYCSAEIGVSDFTNASEEIEILNACRLISNYYNRDWLSQINEKFRSTKEKSPYQLVEEAKTELAALKETLYQLKQYLLQEDRRFWYEKQFEVEKSLGYIESLCNLKWIKNHNSI